ncbi:MAG: succinate dehydrogenase assembly factor 2 [Pseudomonadota bacterium]
MNELNPAAIASRLRWRCRRGMKELDIVLTTWLDKHYATATETERDVFLALLDMDDPDLAVVLLGGGSLGDPESDRVVHAIRASTAP